MTSAITTEPSKTMHRHEVPIDGQPHTFRLSSGPLAVAFIGHAVEFWAEHHGDEQAVARVFQVYGTGHPIPGDARWRGTTARASGLVWHLYELPGVGRG